MTRSWSIAIASLAVAGAFGVSLTSCNQPSCGQGTVQKQQSDGTIKCIAVDYPAPLTPCDVDGGNATIVGGKCVSNVVCDPGTTMAVDEAGKIVCMGTGGTVGCSTPTPGQACVSGKIVDFKTGMPASGPLHLQLYDAVALLNGGAPITTKDIAEASQGYVFQNFTPPQLGLIAVLTGDGQVQVVTATGAKGVGASTYLLDAYTIPKAQADAWGFDYTTGGAFIARYYLDPANSSPTDFSITEKMPAAGVQMIENNMVPAGVKYFKADLSGIDSTLTATAASSTSGGAAIVSAPANGSFPMFTGMGGMLPAGKTGWETEPGGSRGAMGAMPPIVVITRFHPM